MRGKKAKALRAIARSRTSNHSEPHVSRRDKTLRHPPGSYRRIYQDLKRAA